MRVRELRLPALLMVAASLVLQSPGALTAAPTQPGAADELLQADRQFSAAAASRNVVDSIAGMLADEVKVPRPDGTFAASKAEVVASLSTNPSNLTGKARWAPVRVGVSADGQHGFTYGFMTLSNEGQADRRAKYLAYWIKQPAGWRVIAYKRAPSAAGPIAEALRPPAVTATPTPASPDAALTEAHRKSLVSREKAFSDRAREVGLRQAFLEFGSGDAMNIGRDADFVYGNAAIAETLPPDVPSPVVWAADEGAIVASSGDLGITFGYIRSAEPPSKVPFFTIWRRPSPAEEWKYVAE